MEGFTDFLAWCVAPANVGYTLLLGIMALYWAMVIGGALDFSFGTPEGPDLDADLDLDLDADLDADLAVDGDADMDLDTEVHGAPVGMDGGADFDADLDAPDKDVAAKATVPGWLAVLRFFNIGAVPLMLVLSVFVPAAWGLSMLATHWLGVSGWLAGLALFAPVMLAAGLVAKVATTPLKAVFRALNRPARLANPLELAGRECVVITLSADAAHGQAEIPTDGVALTINAVTRAGVTIPKGGRAVVVELVDAERGIYLIESLSGDDAGRGAS